MKNMLNSGWDGEWIWKSKNKPHCNKLCQKFWLWNIWSSLKILRFFSGFESVILYAQYIAHLNAMNCVWLCFALLCWCMFFHLRSLKYKTFARDFIFVLMHSAHMCMLSYICVFWLCASECVYVFLAHSWCCYWIESCMESAFPIRSGIFPVHIACTHIGSVVGAF